MNPENIPDNFLHAVERLANNQNPFTVQMSPYQAWCLVGAVQLATRHPGFTGPSRLTAESVAREISAALTANDPDLRQLAVMGWHQQFDAPIFDGKRYKITSDGRAITCLVCGRTSHNANDVAHRYCAHCHVFHEV